MTRHIAVIGAGITGAATAVELLRDGHRVTILEPAAPGGEQAASYGNAGWFSSMSVIPPSSPGLWRQVPGFLMDPLGPLAIRWPYLPKALPWLLRYLAAGWTEPRVLRVAQALRPLLKDSPVLHAALAAEAGVPDLVEHRGLINAYPSRAAFAAEAMGWRIRRQVGITWSELEGEALRAAEPDLDPAYTFAVLVEEAGRCLDPGRYVAALVAHAQAQGATLLQASATGFRLAAGRLRGVTLADGTTLDCDAAVIAAGARSRALAAAVGDRVPLETERGYHVMLRGVTQGPRHSMSLSTAKMVVNPMRDGLRAAGQVEIAGLAAAPNWKRA
ncbi:MAG TPA: FAD-dependent oxidoreductase, partial [Roseomonas sp.]